MSKTLGFPAGLVADHRHIGKRYRLTGNVQRDGSLRVTLTSIIAASVKVPGVPAPAVGNLQRRPVPKELHVYPECWTSR